MTEAREVPYSESMPLVQTIDQMRGLRGEITKQPSLFVRGTVSDVERQAMLAEASDLGLTAGRYLAAFASREGDFVERLREEWFDTLSDSLKRHSRLKPVTTANTLPNESARKIIDNVTSLSVDAHYFITWDMLIHNRMGAQTIEDLLSRNIGVISPLTGDFINAAIYRGYLDLTDGQTFPLKTVALSGDLKRAVFPEGDFNVPEIAIYLDIVETGQTSEALHTAVLGRYPGKVVHEPNSERVEEIIPSEKMMEVKMRSTGSPEDTNYR